MAENLYVIIPAGLLGESGLSAAEKILLALAAAFDNSGGLRLNNQSLARVLGVNPSTASPILKRLEMTGRIRIENPKSRFRTIWNGGGQSPRESGRAAVDRPGQDDAEKRKPSDDEMSAMMKNLGL